MKGEQVQGFEGPVAQPVKRGMFGRLKKTKPAGWDHGAAGVVKKREKRKRLRVTVFPPEGGSPYLADVEPDEKGMFKLGEGHMYRIMRGSVWEEDGVSRAIVNEANPQTMSVYSLTGDDSFSPSILHAIAENNLWVQLDKVSRAGSPWRQASTWGMIGLGVVLIGVMIWQVATVGGGLEELREAIEGLGAGTGGGEANGGAQPNEPGQSTRRSIAPGG